MPGRQSTWGHEAHVMSAKERRFYSRYGCARQRGCKVAPTVLTRWRHRTCGRICRATRPACATHAAEFARQFAVQIDPAPAEHSTTSSQLLAGQAVRGDGR
jgi:hypothetical protein